MVFKVLQPHGLFKVTAKFVSLAKDEVTLEKSDGKQTTIEFSVLRAVDQEYVNLRLEAETAIK
jgi:hypothetical protein